MTMQSYSHRHVVSLICELHHPDHNRIKYMLRVKSLTQQEIHGNPISHCTIEKEMRQSFVVILYPNKGSNSSIQYILTYNVNTLVSVWIFTILILALICLNTMENVFRIQASVYFTPGASVWLQGSRAVASAGCLMVTTTNINVSHVIIGIALFKCYTYLSHL